MRDNAQLSLPADNFYAFKKSIETYALENDWILPWSKTITFLKLTIKKVRDKIIVADGLVDETFNNKTSVHPAKESTNY
jgi:UPF0176 protein